MAKTFKPSSYGDHRLVIEYKVNGSGQRWLNPANLKQGVDGEVPFALLGDQLSVCAAEYRQNEAAEIKKLYGEPKRLGQR